MSSVSGVDFLEYFAFVFGSEELVGVDADLQKFLIQLDGTPVSKIHALKEFGNRLFRDLKFAFAGDCYDQACRQLGVALKTNFDLDLPSTISLALSLCLNLAACSNKIQAYDGAILFCSMVLTFFPKNSKALFRKAVALRHLNRLSEAIVTLKEAQAIEPHNKDIIQEQEAVVQALEINQNGKRVVLEKSDDDEVRAGKKCVSSFHTQEAGLVLSMAARSSSGVSNKDFSSDLDVQLDPASCFNETQKNQFHNFSNSNDCAPVHSPVVPMDSVVFESSREPEDTLNGEAECLSSSSTNSKSPHFNFTARKHPHKTLKLSSQDYEQLLHGKNLGFYHPSSMSFLRVRTLTTKTIQTGTPHEEISGTAEVPTFSPSLESIIQEEVKLGQEEVVFQVDKKTRLSSATFCVNKVSSVQFNFAAVRGHKQLSQSPKGGCRSYGKDRMSRPIACSKKRSSVPVRVSLSCCRYTSSITTVTGIKRREVQSFEFDAHYHRPFKKYRTLSTSIVSSGFQVSSSLGGFLASLFVI